MHITPINTLLSLTENIYHNNNKKIRKYGNNHRFISNIIVIIIVIIIIILLPALNVGEGFYFQYNILILMFHCNLL